MSRASKGVFWRLKGALDDDLLHFTRAFVNQLHAHINQILQAPPLSSGNYQLLPLHLKAVVAHDFSDWSMASIEVNEQHFLNIANQALQAEDVAMSADSTCICDSEAYSSNAK